MTSQSIDARGPRFAAALTTGVLAVALITSSGWLLAAQALVFALGSLLGVRRSPYGLLFAGLVRPRLGPPAATEDPRPPRFAQTVGLAFAAIGLVGYFAGPLWLGQAAAGCALAAAFLNSAFGFCLGCEMYLLLRRVGGPSVILPRARQPTAAISSVTAAAKASTSASVVSKEHIQRTSLTDSSQT